MECLLINNTLMSAFDWVSTIYMQIKVAQKITFQGENPNSEHTFVSSTLKVEETKVPSEF